MKSNIIVLLVVSLLSLVMSAPREALSQQVAQQVYIIPREIQEFATQSKLYDVIGPGASPSLYVDTLTALDVVATTRATTLRRDRPVQEDYQAASWAWCILPWGPFKKPSDKAEMDKARPLLIQGAFISTARRTDIANRLNRDLLSLSGNDLRTRGIRPQQIIDITRLPIRTTQRLILSGDLGSLTGLGLLPPGHPCIDVLDFQCKLGFLQPPQLYGPGPRQSEAWGALSNIQDFTR